MRLAMASLVYHERSINLVTLLRTPLTAKVALLAVCSKTRAFPNPKQQTLCAFLGYVALIHCCGMGHSKKMDIQHVLTQLEAAGCAVEHVTPQLVPQSWSSHVSLRFQELV